MNLWGADFYSEFMYIHYDFKSNEGTEGAKCDGWYLIQRVIYVKNGLYWERKITVASQL